MADSFYTLHKTEGAARRGTFMTPHGPIEMPAFMNVGTAGAIKGGVSSPDLCELRCQVELCNTYHLHLRPGEEVVRAMGGLHRFMNWERPILTDSGGFQVFSLASLRKIEEAGVTFQSHIDGRRIFMGPEESMRIQSALGSTIAMAFDECIQNPAERNYTSRSISRTTRWLARCRKEMDILCSRKDAVNPRQMLFGINQGSTYHDLRIEHMKAIREIPCEGYAIGGLAVGESAEEMYSVIEAVEPFMPADRPRYLMGVGTPVNILESVRRGVDLFDCVMPSRNARHGHLFTREGIRNLNNEKYKTDPLPIEEGCGCPACRNFSRAYLRHLLRAGEMLAMRLLVMHNLWFYNTLMEDIRRSLDEGRFDAFAREWIPILGRRI